MNTGLYCSNETMGTNELAPGWVPSVFPTDFDNVQQAMAKALRDQFKYPFINPTAYSVVGLFQGPIKLWLTRYIANAPTLGPYTKSNFSAWNNRYINKYKYTQEENELYFSTFRQLHETGRVPTNVYDPTSYKMEKESFLQKSLSGIGGKLLLYGVIGAVVVYGGPTIIKSVAKAIKK